ncbi:MAG: VOC family protein [Mycobacteriales bacterium]
MTPPSATPPPATPSPLHGIAKFRDLCLDANDPAPVATFWAAVLGRDVERDDSNGDVFLPAGPDGGPNIYVNRVPEPKTVKDRIHIDVTLEPGQELSELLRLGGTVVTEPGEVRWWVLADPEGNEFCAFLPDADASNDADAEAPQ